MAKVLVVDDTKNIRILLTTFLELEGYTVQNADNGENALRLLGNDTFDLIFLDIKLHGYSGTEVLRRIRAQGIETPVVIMTAFATVKNAVECTKMGAVAYLQKPFTVEKVRHLLGEINPVLQPNEQVGDLLHLAHQLIEQKKIDQAFAVLKKALARDPSNGEIYSLIGKIHSAWGNHIEAERFAAIAKQFANSVDHE